jgi:hypothetical protein
MDQLEASTFSGRVGEIFHVRVDAATVVDLELLSVVTRDSDRLRAFSMEFRGPLDDFLAQRTYATEHAAIGEFPLFLVPIGQREDGFRYEAVFSRLTGSG